MASNQAYNITAGDHTTLKQLFQILKPRLAPRRQKGRQATSACRDVRPGDVRRSGADISRAMRLLGYKPTHRIEQGLNDTLDWYVAKLARLDATLLPGCAFLRLRNGHQATIHFRACSAYSALLWLPRNDRVRSTESAKPSVGSDQPAATSHSTGEPQLTTLVCAPLLHFQVSATNCLLSGSRSL